jgi:hypothetical protein
MEQLSRSFRRRSRIIIGIGIITLLIALGALIASAIAASHGDRDEHFCCTIFDDGRGEATTTATSMAFSMSQLLINPLMAKSAFISHFAPHGIYSTLMGNADNYTEIDNVLQAYIDTPQESGIIIDIKNMYWDYKKSTLIVEQTWRATTTSTKMMWDSSFIITSFPANTTYTRDEVIIMTFDCYGKVVRYRLSGCSIQRVSTLEDSFPHHSHGTKACHPCDSEPEPEHHPHHPPHPPPTSTPPQIVQHPMIAVERAEKVEKSAMKMI